MKKTKKFLLSAVMIMCLGGCGKADCNCPTDSGTPNEQETVLINDYSELYKKTAPSVVMVRLQRKTDRNYVVATGSGVVVFEEGTYAYIYTNAHVVKDITTDLEVEVVFSNEEGVASGESEIATLMGKDLYEDVAVLRIKKSDKYKKATIGDSDGLSKGDWVYTIGSPLNKFNYTTSGNISATKMPIMLDASKVGVDTTVYAILFDAAINEGNSGGALFDSKGELVGITTIRYDNAYGLYGALPIKFFKKVAEHIMVQETNYIRPTLNLDLLSINELGARREDYGISSYVSNGVYVKRTRESGIVEDVVITEINNVKIHSLADYGSELLKYDVGDTVKLTVIDKDGLNTRYIDIVLHAAA